MSESATLLLSVQALSHRFGGLKVLRSVSFVVPRGRITGLIGPNGAGKSTLFNIVSGFLPAQDGIILYEGADIARWSVRRRVRAGLIRTFQTPRMFGHLTVRENLMTAAWSSTRSGFLQGLVMSPASRRDVAQMAQMADAACERFELQSIWSSRAGDLTAGRQRLVELARAAVASPRLLCLDEPSSGLNVEEVEALRTALARLNADGVSILLVSHDMALMSVAASVHVLCFGEIIASGAFGAVKEDARVREAYLGVYE